MFCILSLQCLEQFRFSLSFWEMDPWTMLSFLSIFRSNAFLQDTFMVIYHKYSRQLLPPVSGTDSNKSTFKISDFWCEPTQFRDKFTFFFIIMERALHGVIAISQWYSAICKRSVLNAICLPLSFPILKFLQLCDVGCPKVGGGGLCIRWKFWVQHLFC